MHSCSLATWYLHPYKQHNQLYILPSSCHLYPTCCPFLEIPPSTWFKESRNHTQPLDFHPFLLCFRNKFLKWPRNLCFFNTSCFKHKSWNKVSLTQTRLVNNAQFHHSLSNFTFFPFTPPINSLYSNCYSMLVFLLIFKVCRTFGSIHVKSREKKWEESVDLIWK